MMVNRIVTVAALALFASMGSAMANTTSVSCPGYVIAIADDVAIEGEIMAGTRTAFETEVCSRSAGIAEDVEGFKVIPVFIEEMGITTRVVVFGGDKN